MQLVPLKIEIKLRTPMYVSSGWPMHIDGLLYWAYHLLGLDQVKALQELDLILLKTGGVYHASQLSLVKSAEQPVTYYEQTRIMTTAWRDYTGGFTHKKTSILENEGPYVRRMQQLVGMTTRNLEGYVVGEAERISYLLNSLPGIGRGAMAGGGSIEQVSVIPHFEDFSWFLSSQLNRVLPVRLFSVARGEPVRLARYAPDYTQSLQEPCYVPSVRYQVN